MATAENTFTMTRFAIMSRLGLAEPLVRLQRWVEHSNRKALAERRAVRSLDRA